MILHCIVFHISTNIGSISCTDVCFLFCFVLFVTCFCLLVCLLVFISIPSLLCFVLFCFVFCTKSHLNCTIFTLQSILMLLACNECKYVIFVASHIILVPDKRMINVKYFDTLHLCVANITLFITWFTSMTHCVALSWKKWPKWPTFLTFTYKYYLRTW